MSKLIYTEAFEYGGGVRYCFDFVKSLMMIDNKITIASNHEAEKYFETFKADGINVLGFFFLSDRFLNLGKWSKPIGNYLAYFLSIILTPILFVFNIILFIPKIKGQHCKEVVVFNGGYPASYSCLAFVVSSKILRKKIFLSIVSVPAYRKTKLYLFDCILDKIINFCTDQIIVNCGAIKKDLVSYRSFDPTKINVVYNSVATSSVDSKTNHLALSNTVTIGYISRVDRNKGIFELVQAFEKISHKYNLVKLLVVGDGDDMQAVRSYVYENCKDGSVEILGFFKGDILSLHQRIDIFVLPSYWEGFPYAILEAASQKKCVISTDVGGISELVKDRETGILVSPGDVDSLYKAIELLLEDQSLIKLYGESIYKLFISNFSSTSMNEKVKSIWKIK